MSKILITGANGYLGRHVVDAVLAKGHDVLAADFNFDGVNPKATQVNTPIFSDSENLFEELGSPDVVLHLAWRNGFVHNADSHIDDLPNHYHFVEKMINSGVKQIVVMGSMHEIGYHEGAIDEDTPANPSSLYGISKNALRQATFVAANGKDTVVQWLRAYYIVGDDTKASSIFGKITEAEQEGKAEFPFTTGKNKFDFINIDELSNQIASVVSQNEVSGVINVATGKPMSLAERVEQFISDNGYKIKLKYGAFPDRPYDSPGVWANVDKITKILDRETGK
jgi:dTDP-6-deoxy-L-talose 4-dehydrogenase (NAD+)